MFKDESGKRQAYIIKTLGRSRAGGSLRSKPHGRSVLPALCIEYRDGYSV